jgi:uncharacterized tellurite resistance protein B-like protein
MTDFLRALLGLDTAEQPGELTDPGLVAAAALMLEAARLDGEVTAAEEATIEGLLRKRFRLDAQTVEHLLDAAHAKADDSVGWQAFTREIKDGFDHAGRIALVEMLWEVIFADGELHDYEASLMRRVAGLLYITDGESAAARARALDRLGLTPPAV